MPILPHRRLPLSLATLLAVTSVSLLAQPRQVWPTAGWTKAAPQSQGINAARFAELDRDVESGVYGNIDRMLVVRGGHLVIDERYARDYRAISRGQKGPLGCGEGCSDPAAMNEFNYLHPNWHPYYQGRDVHTLQSVTKSIAATIVGIALGQKEIASVEVPFLSFFKDRNLAKVDPQLHQATLQDLLTMRSGIEWHESDGRSTRRTRPTSSRRARTGLPSHSPSRWTRRQERNGATTAAAASCCPASSARRPDGSLTTTRPRCCSVRWHPRVPLEKDADRTSGYGGGLIPLSRGPGEDRTALPPRWSVGRQTHPAARIRPRATTRHVTGLQGGWDYGYQWWLTSRGGEEVGPAAASADSSSSSSPPATPSAIIHSWNVFGGRARPIFERFLAALMTDN